jgi:hypothetical protein
MTGWWEQQRHQACQVAAEHYLWARKDGQSLADILLSIGHIARPGVGEDDVLVALEREWLMICEPYKKARPVKLKTEGKCPVKATDYSGRQLLLARGKSKIAA